ncbi:MAG: phosphoribosylformylglycinamidine synthase subunit PurL [Planctomycetota bacterium]|nr:phosphoribosylformylglycinamidine synthase subunit PurL [Planctomycetota bacterium]
MAPLAEVETQSGTGAPDVGTPPDAWRIEVWRRAGTDDPEGSQALGVLAELGIDGVEAVRTARGYLLSPRYAAGAVADVAAELLADPLVDEVEIDEPGSAPDRSGRGGTHRIAVLSRPGVMDPVAGTVERLLVRTGQVPPTGAPDVATFRVYELRGSPTAEELQEAATRVFANETVEIVLIDREDLPYEPRGPLGSEGIEGLEPGAALRGRLHRGRVEVPLLDADRDLLHEISREGVLSLNLEEMRTVQEHFRGLGREPSACELETIAQTWSEHCKHKTMTGIIEFEGPDGTERIDDLLRSTIARATHELDRPWCVSVFEDNAGIIAFDKGFDIAVKVETHNHPSALDPYGGAGTGIGGVIRDVLGAGLGARPIANTDCFFVGPLDLPREAVPKGTLHPRRILRGVVAGVRDYGNRMGIPTVNGGVWFDERYTANPLVYCGTVGILPHAHATKEVRPGDAIVTVGGRTGRDGIHGATFSSVELSEESEDISGSAVQIGDPITEKRVLDCLMQARDRGLYRGITDCGAGGFSSAVGEMGERCGAEVDVDRVPLKYPGLSSHEIWISEAQERMVLAVPPENVDELLAVFAAEDVEATVIGSFTDTHRLVVKDRGETVGDLAMDFLHHGGPRPVRAAVWTPPELPDPGCPAPEDAEGTEPVGQAILRLLALPNIASKEWIVRQYDHEVQGRSVVKPLVGAQGDGPGDAAVLQPLYDSRRGLAIACGANPRYGLIDPYAMAAAAIDEALRNAVAVGGDPAYAALLDNFSWGNCDKPDQLGSLVQAAKACHRAAIAYGTPFISGKDSLNNEYRIGERTIAIPPTLLITCVAQLPDVARAITMDLKRAGDRIYLLGRTRAELGGSHWLQLRGLFGGRVPSPDLQEAPRILRALHREIVAGHVSACHDLSEGGLAVAAAEMAFAGGLGLSLDLGAVPCEDLEAGYDEDAVRLFSESCTRFLVEVPRAHATAFEEALGDIPFAPMGSVLDEPFLHVRGVRGASVATVPIEELRGAFNGGFAG